MYQINKKKISDVIEDLVIPDLGISEYNRLVNPNYSVKTRCVYLSIIIVCFVIFWYQVINRIDYYFQYPLSVDVHIQPLGSVMFEVKFMKADNAYIHKKLNENNIKIFLNVEQPYAVATLLKNRVVPPFDEKLWQFDNETPIIHHISNLHNYKKNSPQAEVKVVSKGLTVMGRYITLDLSNHVKDGVHIVLTTRDDYFNIVFVILNENSDFKAGEILIGERLNDYIIDFTKHINYDTRRNPCVNEAKMRECSSNCFKKLIKSTSKCRLPVHDISLGLPNCSNYEDALKIYKTSVKLQVEQHYYGECKCVRPCTRITFIAFKKTIRHFGKQEIILYSGDIEYVLEERLVYDKISLLTDIGGNLGLFLGFSLLSFLNILHRITLFIKAKTGPKKNVNLNFNQRLVLKTYNFYMKSQSKKLMNAKTKEKKFWKKVKIIFWIFCTLIAFFMIQNRFEYYFEHPTRLFIKVEVKQHVTFPSVTVCNVNKRINFKKRTFAKKNNVSDWCSVQLIDLWDSEKKQSLTNLWDSSYLEQISYDMREMFEKLVDVKMMGTNLSEIYTHVGKCSHLKFKEVPYIGLYTSYLHAYALANPSPCTKPINTPFKFPIYTDDIGSDSYDIITESYLPINAFSVHDFSFRNVIRLNKKTKPCTTKENYTTCKKQCFDKLIENGNICRLPFLLDFKNLRPCTSKSEAKEGIKKFVSISLKTSSGKICNCTSSCSENILLHRNQLVRVTKSKSSWVVLSMLNSVTEHIIEVRNYLFGALLGDIGNIVGMALGISVLTIFITVQEVFTVEFLKLRMKIST